MNPLNVFYQNETQREAVKEFMVDTLKQIAVEKTFNGESVEGIMEAHDLIERSFNRLEELYGIIKPPVISNSR